MSDIKNDIAVQNKSEITTAPKTMGDALIDIVTRKDVDPDRLEKLLNLQFKYEDRQSEKAYNSAISFFQGECPIITKKKKVDFKSKSGNTTKYDYAPLDEIVHVVKPILAKYELSYSFNIDPMVDNYHKLIVTISHSEGHSKEFFHFFNPLHDDARMNQSQRIKSALSYAKRAGLENALGIVTQGTDDDAARCHDNPITDDQLSEIERIAQNTDTDKKRLLAFLKVDELTELSEFEAKKAILKLKQKRAK